MFVVGFRHEQRLSAELMQRVLRPQLSAVIPSRASLLQSSTKEPAIRVKTKVTTSYA